MVHVPLIFSEPKSDKNGKKKYISRNGGRKEKLSYKQCKTKKKIYFRVRNNTNPNKQRRHSDICQMK